MAEEKQKLDLLKEYVCAAETVGDFLHRIEAVRADILGGLDYDISPCQCCTFGNHDIICTCDGEGCCHPEAYKEYNPAWGHAPLKKEPEKK